MTMLSFCLASKPLSMTTFHTDEETHFLNRVTPETTEEPTFHGTRIRCCPEHYIWVLRLNDIVLGILELCGPTPAYCRLPSW